MMIFSADIPTPYTAVIFSSVRPIEVNEDGYAEMAGLMEELASQQPGYLGIELARDPQTGFGITVSYWKNEESANAWKLIPEHLTAQKLGRQDWYREYAVRVVTVNRAYDFRAE